MTSERPKLTVAIPAFNREHLLGKAIESAIGQTLRSLEVLVVDDASTDGTASVAEAYVARDPRVRLVRNEQNLGLTRNWNRCLALASGDYVNLLSSDDELDPDYLEVAVKILEADDEVALVATGCRYIDAKGAVIDAGKSLRAGRFGAGDEAVKAFLEQGFPHVSGIVVRSQAIKEVGGYEEDIWHGPDVEFDARLGSRYPIVFVEGVHSSFRRHGANMGVLEFLRPDFLEADERKRRAAWGKLTGVALRAIGVTDFEVFIKRSVAVSALTGATVSVGLGRRDVSVRYLQKAWLLSKTVPFERQFWKVILLLLLGPLGTHVMRTRMGISERDCRQAEEVERSLANLPISRKGVA